MNSITFKGLIVSVINSWCTLRCKISVMAFTILSFDVVCTSLVAITMLKKLSVLHEEEYDKCLSNQLVTMETRFPLHIYMERIDTLSCQLKQ